MKDSDDLEADGITGLKEAESQNHRVEDGSPNSLLDNDMNDG